MLENQHSRRGILTGTASGLFGIGVLAAFGPGKVKADPKQAPPPLEVFAASPVISLIALSPDGNMVAVITELKGKKYLGYFDTTTMQPKAIPIGDVKSLDLIWADNQSIVYVASETRKTGGIYAVDLIEQARAFYVNIKNNKPIDIFSGIRGYAESGIYSEVKRYKLGDKYHLHLLYSATISNVDQIKQLIRISFDGKGAETVISTSDNLESWVITPDGETAYCAVFFPQGKEWHLYYLKNPTPTTRLVGPIFKMSAKETDASLVGWAQDGVSVIVSVGEGEGREYFEVNPQGKRGATLGGDQSKYGKSPLFNPKTQRIAGFARHDDWFSYDYFDPFMASLANAVPQKLDEGQRWSFAGFADDPRKLLVYTESKTNSGEYFFIDFTKGDLKLVGENYPDLAPEWITEKTPMDYTAADGLRIHAYLTLPPAREAKDLALVVMPHGGPESRDFIDFDWQVQALASRGYAVLQPNFRGSSGYGESFVRAGHGEWGRKMQTDLSDGVRALAKQGLINPKRVAILGASYGGYAALAGATLDQGIYRCAVSIAGVSDPGSMTYYEKKKYGRHSAAVNYWQEYLGPAGRLGEVSPLRQAANAYCPILIVHGKDDTVVPFSQSHDMKKALDRASKPVEFLAFDGQDHWETNETARIAMLKAAVDFIEKHNPA